MFEVRCVSPLDDEWEARDELIYQVAGHSSFSGGGCGGRDHGWYVDTFEEAKELMDKLNTIPLVEATFKEATTHHRKKKYKK